MAEPQAKRMQRLTANQHGVLFVRQVWNQLRHREPIAVAVHLVGEHRATDVRQVDANLVRSPRSRLHPHQRVPAEPLQHFVIAQGVLRIGIVGIGGDRHLLAVVGVVLDAGFDVIRVAVQFAHRERDVLLEHLASFELIRALAVGLVVLGHENHAAGVFVQSVYDAGPVSAVLPAEFFVEEELQRIHERAGPIPLRGVYDHVGRLVDDREELVLKENIERDVFGDGQVVVVGRHLDVKSIVVADLVARLARPIIHEDAAGFDGPLQLGAAEIREVHVKVLVEPHRLEFDAGDEIDGLARTSGNDAGFACDGFEFVVGIGDGHG